MFQFIKLKTQSSEHIRRQGKTPARANACNNLSPSPRFQFDLKRALMNKMTQRNLGLQTV